VNAKRALIPKAAVAAEVVEGASLPELARQIDSAIKAANAHAAASVDAALTAGRLLAQAKSKVEHGEWEPWIAANTSIAPRTARAYMRLAERFPTLPEEERHRVAVLPLREAMKAIATPPSAPPRDKSAVYRAPRGTAKQLHANLIKQASTFREAATQIATGGYTVRKLANIRERLTKALALVDRLAQEAGRA
jgi:hypothetical protein